MGESDNVPKDPNYVYRLHKALGNYMQAAGTALIIAKQEQEEGNYKSAHKLLFDTFKDMESQNIPVSRSPRGACPRLSVARLCRARAASSSRVWGSRRSARTIHTAGTPCPRRSHWLQHSGCC